MTTEIPVPEGPPCDFCTDWPAVGSLMNLADYTTQKFCASCGPAFLVGIVEAMTGAQIMVPAGSAPEPAAAGLTADEIQQIEDGWPAPDQDDEPGSKADHWASTTHVRRSTHGHRGAAKAKAGDDE